MANGERTSAIAASALTSTFVPERAASERQRRLNRLRGWAALVGAAFLASSACSPTTDVTDAGPEPDAPVPAPIVEVQENGSFSVQLDELGLREVEAFVLLPGEVEYRLSDAPDLMMENEAGIHRISGTLEGIALRLELETKEDHVRARLHAQGDARIRGFVLRGRATGGAKGVYQEGYSSWSPAHYVTLGQGDPGENTLTGVDGDHLFADPRISWWMGALHYAQGTLVTGALSANAFKTRVLSFLDEEDDIAWRMVVGGTNESIPAADGVDSEELYFGIGNVPTSALDAYGVEVNEVQPMLAPPFIPTGWNTWNTYFTDITPEDVLETATLLQETLPGLRLNNIQIDDGWQVAWGDWVENEKFADGIDKLADDLRARGFKPGIWWAPFLADIDSETVTNHPEWLLLDEVGEPVFYGSSTLGYRYYVLDISHPDVREFVLTTLDRLLDAGFRYLKLDFLFGGASEGVRYDIDSTGLMAFASLVDEMSARAQEKEAYLLACGAPLLPSAGRFHALRTGDDIAFADLSYSFAMNKNAFRNLASRFYVNRFLTSDPDTVLVREISEETQKLNITATLLSGRILNLGDNMRTLDAERLGLLQQIPELYVPATFLRDPEDPAPLFRPIDLFETPNVPIDNKFAHILAPDDYVVPSLWYLRLDEEKSLLAVINWWDEEEWRQVPLPADAKNATSAKGLWSQTALSVENGRISMTIPARGVRLLLLR